MSKLERMSVSNFKYIITNIGGGWAYIHHLYGVASNGNVYMTSIFDESKLDTDYTLDVKFIGHLDNTELGLSEDITYAVMDAPDLTVYEVEEVLKVLHNAPEITKNNPQLYTNIQQLVYVHNKLNYAKQHTGNKQLVIGEITNSDDVKSLLKALNTGTPMCITHHNDSSHIVNNMNILRGQS